MILIQATLAITSLSALIPQPHVQLAKHTSTITQAFKPPVAQVLGRGQWSLATLKGRPQLSAAAAVHRRQQRSLKLGGGAHQDADLMELLQKKLEKNCITACKCYDAFEFYW